jgi:hypothetical protein
MCCHPTDPTDLNPWNGVTEASEKWLEQNLPNSILTIQIPTKLHSGFAKVESEEVVHYDIPATSFSWATHIANALPL